MRLKKLKFEQFDNGDNYFDCRVINVIVGGPFSGKSMKIREIQKNNARQINQLPFCHSANHKFLLDLHDKIFCEFLSYGSYVNILKGFMGKKKSSGKIEKMVRLVSEIYQKKRGVVTFDDFDMFDYRLMDKYIKFIYELCLENKTQLFLSISRGDIIEYFSRQVKDNDIMTFVIRIESDKKEIKYIEGERLKVLIETLGYDFLD